MSNLLTIMSCNVYKGNAAYPMCKMSSLRVLSPVHIAILSPLLLFCTTAPHTSSELRSNPSPIKHISCKQHPHEERNQHKVCQKHTVSIQQLSKQFCLSFFSRFSNQRPPFLFLGSSHIGSMPSYSVGTVNKQCVRMSTHTQERERERRDQERENE